VVSLPALPLTLLSREPPLAVSALAAVLAVALVESLLATLFLAAKTLLIFCRIGKAS
jgi:hypothetical protein